MSDARPTRPFFESLTGVRFFFGLYVVFNHFVILYTIAARDAGPEPNRLAQFCIEGTRIFTQNALIQGIVQGTNCTVNFFFILSGFVLTYTCLDREYRTRIDPRRFWINRLIRVYPMYLLGLLTSFPVFLVVSAPKHTLIENVGICASTVALTQAWWPKASIAWNAPGWSLSAEIFFYLTFPWLVVALDRWGRKQLWALLAGCYVASIVPVAIYMAVNPDGLPTLDWLAEGTWLTVLKHNPIVRIPEFLSGIVFCKLFARELVEKRRGGGGQGLFYSTCALAGIAAVICGAYWLNFMFLHNGLLTPLFLVLIYGLAAGGGPIEWLLSRQWMVTLGETTYAVYILHFSLIAYSVVALDDRVNKKGEAPPDPVMNIVTTTLFILVVSYVAYRWFEIPNGRKLRKRFLDDRTHAPAAVPVEHPST